MKREKFLKGLIWGLLSSLIMLGCMSEEKGEDSDQIFGYGEFSLEKANGGFDQNSQVDIFEVVDPEIYNEDSTVYQEDESIVESIKKESSDQHVKVYILRIIWGQLSGNPGVREVIRWDGTIFSEDAVIRIERLIRFERFDHVLPRYDARIVEYISRTRPHNDGLLLRIVVPKAAFLSGYQPTLTFASDLLVKTFALKEFEDGFAKIIKVDGFGNKVSFVGFAIKPCPEGFLGGYWKRINRRGGIFGGKWIDEIGIRKGELGGIWGRDRTGERVFYGIYLEFGEFGGILRGTYTPDEAVAGGTFEGEWVDKDLKPQGILYGHYGLLPYTHVVHKGYFHGVWEKDCRDCERDKKRCR
jgi:hypothetical protein